MVEPPRPYGLSNPGRRARREQDLAAAAPAHVPEALPAPTDETMDIRADEISRILREQIQDYGKKVTVAETGTVLSQGDGIARVYGLEGVLSGELVEFKTG